MPKRTSGQSVSMGDLEITRHYDAMSREPLTVDSA